jgi:hypothetical protein
MRLSPIEIKSVIFSNLVQWGGITIVLEELNDFYRVLAVILEFKGDVTTTNLLTLA